MAGEREIIIRSLQSAGRRYRAIPFLYPALERILRRERVAHIHRSIEYADVLGSRPTLLPWIFTLHGLGFEEHWGHDPAMIHVLRDYNEAALRVVQAAPRATVVARWLRDYVFERTGVSPAVTPPGIDLGEFARSNADGFLRKSGLPPGFVLWVGRLVHEKGLDTFVNLAARIPDRAFVVLTDRPRSEAEREVKGLWPKNLHYLDSVPRPLVVSAFHGCSIHVSTSRYESASTTLPEAMACGKAVVGPDLYGPREIIGDSQGGFLYDPASPDDLERQVLRALDHPELGQRGQAFVREHRDWRKLALFFDREYEELAGER
ncbi:MAG TPA: glycosyltransferase family 4 protein [Thermoplasmata archaeon]|nr:glycosyltransferase family 4 protein [Thermoplasmata archaeon]